MIQQHWIPDGSGGYTVHQQNYDYDALNRLKWTDEYLNGATPGTGGQSYSYDRWGNRSLSGAPGLNNQQFSIDPNTNRYGVPGGQSGTMTYDSAGNLITDTYSGGGARTYDAENRMTSATESNSKYSYDGDGHRVKRNVNGTETWQVYGLGGELLAEYAANASPLSPQKEYGYRNGELLVTVTSTPGDAHWLVTDQLGTARMIADQTGSLTGVSRHDYLPFREELYAGTGGRTTAQGYSASDGVRQHFTGKQRDNETGLDFFEARYYASMQGRFTSVDLAGPELANPQTLNMYEYSLNNPLRYTDPTGRYEEDVRDLTIALAYAAGFSMSESTTIGNRDQYVDDDPKTNPEQFDLNGPGYEARRDYHFTTEERRNELWNSFEITGRAAALDAHDLAFWDPHGTHHYRASALDQLGVYLRAEQDSFSHAGYGPRLGHLLAGHAPDKTYNNVGKADRMALDTYNRLTQD